MITDTGWALRFVMLTRTMLTGACIVCMPVAMLAVATRIIRSALLTRLVTVSVP